MILLLKEFIYLVRYYVRNVSVHYLYNLKISFLSKKIKKKISFFSDIVTLNDFLTVH